MTTQATTEHPLGENTANGFVTHYQETLKQFLISLGATVDNAHEFELRQLPDDPFSGQIWHQDKLVGLLSIRYQGDDPPDGIRWVIVTAPIPTKPLSIP